MDPLALLQKMVDLSAWASAHGLRLRSYKLTLREAEVLMLREFPNALNRVEYWTHRAYFIRQYWDGRPVFGAVVRVLP